MLLVISVTFSINLEKANDGVWLSNDDLTLLANHINNLVSEVSYRDAKIEALEEALRSERAKTDEILKEVDRLLNTRQRPVWMDLISWLTLAGVGVLILRLW